MERLTEKHYLGTDHYMKCSGNCNVDMDCIDCPSFDRLVERLAAYEDTGLSSQACAEAREAGKVLSSCDISFGRLAELLTADKDGRLVVLPCKVGDTVYWVHGAVITECKVYRVQKNRKGLYICLKSNVSHGAFCADLSIGKTVFLTSEEAEEALEAMKK